VATQRNARILSELHKHRQCVQEESPKACELRMHKHKRCLQENPNVQRLRIFGKLGTHTNASDTTTLSDSGWAAVTENGASSSSTPTRKL